MMKQSIRDTLLAMAGLGLTVGCGHPHTMPPQLLHAQSAYNRAAAGPTPYLAPQELSQARLALKQAHKAFEIKPYGFEARDLAYIAERKAQLAESSAQMATAEQQRTQAHQEFIQAQSRAHARAAQELAKTRQELAKTEQDMKNALSKLHAKQDKRGLVVTLSGKVLFTSGTSILRPEAQRQLQDIAEVLKGAKAKRIRIEGFTDSTGSLQRNQRVSLNRAKAVMNHLIEQGVESHLIEAVGRGPSDPIARNNTNEGRAKNRRVEIVIQTEATALR